MTFSVSKWLISGLQGRFLAEPAVGISLQSWAHSRIKRLRSMKGSRTAGKQWICLRLPSCCLLWWLAHRHSLLLRSLSSITNWFVTTAGICSGATIAGLNLAVAHSSPITSSFWCNKCWLTTRLPDWLVSSWNYTHGFWERCLLLKMLWERWKDAKK